MWIIMQLQSWDTLKLASGQTVLEHKLLAPEPHCIGFLLVFDDYDRALEYAGSDPDRVMEIAKK